jgi:hypothetical protein
MRNGVLAKSVRNNPTVTSTVPLPYVVLLTAYDYGGLGSIVVFQKKKEKYIENKLKKF